MYNLAETPHPNADTQTAGMLKGCSRHTKQDLEYVEDCKELQSLDLSHNQIGVDFLTARTPYVGLDDQQLKENFLTSLHKTLKGLPYLKCVSLHGNPFNEPLPEYKRLVLDALPSLKWINGYPVPQGRKGGNNGDGSKNEGLAILQKRHKMKIAHYEAALNK
eukprot:GHVN01105742.1.p1 GENE.GHVN01105742.1~~GHVN01105742.1.p1  ORF type:complete len:162 (+),score=24.26 GHVN01105742.1:542-1027(+)